MKKLMFIAFVAIATMAVMASCNNKKQTEEEQTRHVYSCDEYFSFAEDTVFLLSESGERIGQCTLHEIRGENELFSDDEYSSIGLNDYFITDDLGNPLIPYSLNEYDSYEYENIYSGDTLKRWFIPSVGHIDTVYCTFGLYERKSLVYNIVLYYSQLRHITITEPDNIRFYCGSGVATFELGDKLYEYPFKDQWLSVIEYDDDRDVVFLAYGLKVSSFSFDEITVIETVPRWVIPLENKEEIQSWYDGVYKPESYIRANFTWCEFEHPERYSLDVINGKIYDTDGNEINVDDIIKR